MRFEGTLCHPPLLLADYPIRHARPKLCKPDHMIADAWIARGLSQFETIESQSMVLVGGLHQASPRRACRLLLNE
jgi:hypothetical protein